MNRHKTRGLFIVLAALAIGITGYAAQQDITQAAPVKQTTASTTEDVDCCGQQ